MAPTQQRRKDLEAQQAAYLCAKHGMTQAEIGRLLGGLSQSRVSRLLQRAEECGWLRRSYEFIPDGISPARLEQLKRFVEPSSLIERLASIESRTGVRVRGVHVVDNGLGGTSSRAWEARLSRFGRSAGETLAEMISRSDVFAVTWGKTVSSLVDNSKAELWRRTASRAIRFVPVCGEPHGRGSDRDTSSQLAARLHALVRSTAPAPPSLTGVPALIARKYHGASLRVIRRFVDDAASYRDVFGKTNPMIEHVDSLLTAVGAADHPMGFIFDELLTAGSTSTSKLTEARLKKLVVGDLGGVLIPRPGLRAREQREVERLNEMWTGAKLHHFERIAQAAARSTRPGVIIAAIGGEDRAEIIAAVIRYGLVNELIIDRTLSDALTKALA
jgi:DNA-binding transcriptional regulator LsrR (DeoR family)